MDDLECESCGMPLDHSNDYREGAIRPFWFDDAPYCGPHCAGEAEARGGSEEPGGYVIA